MDWPAVLEEAIGYLSEYLRIDTSNPPGNERAGADWLGGILAREGIPFDIYESDPSRASLLACLSGRGRGKPLILLNHIDVVQAQASEWQVSPFSGEQRDGCIWGRGAMDMKGVGIMELMALMLAHREGLDLQRDLVFLAVADEEAGGARGAGFLMEEHSEKLQADLVVNEGGYGNLSMIPDRPLLMVATDEKTALWLRLTMRGPGGHGSMPTPEDAPARLVSALARLLEAGQPLQLRKATRAFFRQLAVYWEVLAPFEQDRSDETLLQIVRDNHLDAIPALRAMLANTVALTELHAGQQPNVRPERAEAVLDCRLLPGTDPDAFIGELKRQAAEPGLDFEIILGERHEEYELGGPGFELTREVLGRHFPEAPVAPIILPGISDSRFFRAAGIPTLGIPLGLFELSSLVQVHGVDERLSVENLLKGIQVLYDLVVSFCTASSDACPGA